MRCARKGASALGRGSFISSHTNLLPRHPAAYLQGSIIISDASYTQSTSMPGGACIECYGAVQELRAGEAPPLAASDATGGFHFLSPRAAAKCGELTSCPRDPRPQINLLCTF
mgnify:CR=1 FL=1